MQEARVRLAKLAPDEAYAELVGTPDAPAFLVDVRLVAQRGREGRIGGSLIVERNVARLDRDGEEGCMRDSRGSLT